MLIFNRVVEYQPIALEILTQLIKSRKQLASSYWDHVVVWVIHDLLLIIICLFSGISGGPNPVKKTSLTKTR